MMLLQTMKSWRLHGSRDRKCDVSLQLHNIACNAVCMSTLLASLCKQDADINASVLAVVRTFCGHRFSMYLGMSEVVALVVV